MSGRQATSSRRQAKSGVASTHTSAKSRSCAWGRSKRGPRIDLAEAKGMIGAPGHDMGLDETAKAFLAAVDAAQAA